MSAQIHRTGRYVPSEPQWTRLGLGSGLELRLGSQKANGSKLSDKVELVKKNLRIEIILQNVSFYE